MVVWLNWVSGSQSATTLPANTVPLTPTSTSIAGSLNPDGPSGDTTLFSPSAPSTGLMAYSIDPSRPSSSSFS